jgi:hypothetical protein
MPREAETGFAVCGNQRFPLGTFSDEQSLLSYILWCQDERFVRLTTEDKTQVIIPFAKVDRFILLPS